MLDFTYNFSLGASDNGNVTGITNNRDTTRSQSFTYDSLNRIATAKTSSTSGTTCWDEAFSYDPWGNLLSIGRISGYTCSNEELLNVAATTKNQISGNTYDAAGNLITIPSIASYTYDAENHLKTAAGVTYTYDGAGNRVQKSSGKLYWYGMGSDPLDETDLAGNTNNASFNEYIFFVGKRIARRDSTNAVNYYFADHLGTARIVTNASGSVCYDADFYPFGGERSITSTCSQNYKFTSKERDGESGLDNFGARFDSSSLGRFTSPDPSMDSVKLRNPQSWNRYTYTINNPLRFVDPDGELWVASGVANDPYKWVDECEDGNVCYEAVAAAIGNSLRIYGSDNSGDVTNFQANANGMVDLNDINQQHDAAFDVNSNTPYSYVDVKMGAAFFNFVQDYQSNYEGAPNLRVNEAGSEDGSSVPGHLEHRGGLQIDLRYVDQHGRDIRNPEAYNMSDADRMWDIFRMAHNNGMTNILAGDDDEWLDFAHQPTNPNADPHYSHFHLAMPNPRPPRN